MNYAAKLVLVGAALSFACSAAEAGKYQMRPIEKFNRCYNRLVRKPLPVSGTSKGFQLAQLVASNKMSATDACVALLDHAALDASGVLKNRNDSEARDILETLHNFHNSFFKGQALSHNAGYDNMTLLMKDIDEPSLYFTQSLFSGLPVSNVLTSKVTLKSVRESNFQGANKNFDTRSVTPIHHAHVTAKYGNTGVLLVTERVPASQNSAAATIRPTYEGIFKEAMDKAKASGVAAEVTAVTNTINSYINAFKVVKSQPVSDAEFIGQGRILGVKDQTGLTVPLSGSAYNGVPFSPESFDSFNLHNHVGGGILGSQIYYMKNTNLGQYVGMGGNTNDPYASVPRRFTSRIYEDLLCHTLPTLTEADVRNEVDISSRHGFKTTASCMRCHSSFDDLAGVYRNMIVVRTAANRGTSMPQEIPIRELGNPVAAVMQFTIPASAKTDKTVVGGKSIENRVRDTFALQPPVGRLMYRDHAGGLNKTDDISSVSQLGSVMAQSDDFYRCVAKRYYHFLTGIDVELTAHAADLDAAGKYHKAFVYNLGRILKGDSPKNETEKAYKQSMRGLIRMIVDGEAFSNRDFGITGQ